MHPLAPAMHENYLAALEQITVLGAGGEVARLGPWLLLDAGEEFDYFNIAALVRESRQPLADLQAAIGWFEAREKPFRFIFRDDADALSLRAATGLGFETAESEPAMVLEDLAPPGPVPSFLRISRVRCVEEADTYAAVEPEDSGNLQVRRLISRRSLALPGCSLFLGSVDEAPAARSMGLRTGAMAGVYNVFVREEFRRRGLGEALTAAVIEDARAAGARGICLSSTAIGYRMYLRMGFEPVFRYVSMWRPS